MEKKDIVILISSSGKSKNMISCQIYKAKNKLFTLQVFKALSFEN